MREFLVLKMSGICVFLCGQLAVVFQWYGKKKKNKRKLRERLCKERGASKVIEFSLLSCIRVVVIRDIQVKKKPTFLMDLLGN